MSTKKQKIVIAMSGGVDSSVAAALLKKAGFDVIGVFMKFWSAPENQKLLGSWNRCCSPETEKRARLVAKILGIPFYVFNFEKEFKKKVVDYFLKEYKEGKTPNPCVVCNKKIKFGFLLEKVLSLGSNLVATGHYARLKQGTSNYKLLKAKDRDKDQSYFLWQLSQNQLKSILFPIGDYTKTEVKNLAKKFKLPVSNLPESQEVCFIKTTLENFLNQYLKAKPGRIINNKGKILGKHKGLIFYTIGQRKGIGLAGGPFWVFKKDVKKNVLVVTKNENDLKKKDLVINKINWISGKESKFPIKVKAKIRYRHKPAEAVLNKNKLIFKKSQRAITSGQSIVFYKGQKLLGGGIIK